MPNRVRDILIILAMAFAIFMGIKCYSPTPRPTNEHKTPPPVAPPLTEDELHVVFLLEGIVAAPENASFEEIFGRPMTERDHQLLLQHLPAYAEEHRRR